MSRTTRWLAAFPVWACILAVGMSFGVSTGEKVKTQGLIVSRQQNGFTIRTQDLGEFVAVVTDHTKIYKPHGWFGKDKMSTENLVPGLWVKLEGVANSPGNVLAMVITFSGNDQRTANAIQAGLTPLDAKVEKHEQQIQANQANIQANQQQIESTRVEVAANKQDIQASQQKLQQVNQRVSEIANYDVRSTSFVYFSTGSAELTPQAKTQLAQVAKNVQRMSGYMVQVKGYTDSSGRAATNQDLSMRRAEAVIAYLMQEGKVPLTNVLSPGGMGETEPVSSNESLKGRAENRRAEVKVLVSRGLLAAED